MKEKDFVKILYKKLKNTLKGYSITKGESIFYSVIVNYKGKFEPRDDKKSVRGDRAFQTDLLIKRWNLPLVAIETKIKGFSTHDILTYSAKAIKHKEIYPYLRYSFVVGNSKSITNKFFTHNRGIDSVIVVDVKNLMPFIRMIKTEIKNAEAILHMLKEKNRTKSYHSRLKIENI